MVGICIYAHVCVIANHSQVYFVHLVLMRKSFIAVFIFGNKVLKSVLFANL